MKSARLLLLLLLMPFLLWSLQAVPEVLVIKRQLASSDNSVLNGDTTIAVCLYNVGCAGGSCPGSCTGTALVCDTQVVTVSGGFFTFKLDISSVADSLLLDTLYLSVSVKNGASYEQLCPRETLYATLHYVLASYVSGMAYDIADGIVTTNKIADDAVTATKVASNSLDSTHIADDAITSNELADGAVTNDKIGETIKVNKGGTGLASISNHALLEGTGGSALGTIEAPSSSDVFLHWDGSSFGYGKPYWVSLFIQSDGDTVIDTIFHGDTVESEERDSTVYSKLGIKYLFLYHKTITSSTTLDDTTTVYLCDASGGAIKLTLTSPSSNEERVIYVKKIDQTNNVTIDAGAGYVIDGSQTYVLSTQYQAVVLFCDGERWWIISDK